MHRETSYRSLFLSLTLILLAFFATSLLSAWTGPTAAPPGNNVAAPINVGSTDQIKDGGLGVNALAVFGNQILSGSSLYLNFGANSGSEGYGIRDNGGVMEYKDSGGTWTPFSSLTTEEEDEVTQLHNGTHDSGDCALAGGTLRAISGGDYLCEFAGSSCVAGWTKLSNWSSTQSRSCSGSNSNGCSGATSCSTGNHAFANTAPESCTYRSSGLEGVGDSPSCGTDSHTCGPATLLSVGCY